MTTYVEPSQSLQQSLKNLCRAYQNFPAKRAEEPCKKKKGKDTSFRYPGKKQIKLGQCNNRIPLPEPGWIRYRNSRPVLGNVGNVTVKRP